jgi:hypothetical protein
MKMEDPGESADDNEDDDKELTEKDKERFLNGSEESLEMFVFYLFRKLDAVAKRMIVSMFLDIIGVCNRSNPYGLGPRRPIVELSSESKSYVSDLLEHADMIFCRSLSKRQRELYNHFSTIRIFMKNELTLRGYIELLNTCNSLTRLTCLPFSIDQKYGGLSNWDEWNGAIEQALESGREKFGRKKRKE